MIFRFMDANKADFPVRFMALCFGVSTSGFYEWRHRQSNPCRRVREDAELIETITEIWYQSRGIYGAPRVWAELRLGRDVRVGRKRVERLMRLAGIEGVTGDAGVAAPGGIPRPSRRMIWSIDVSQPTDRTGCGWPISPNIGRRLARCIWRCRRCLVSTSGRLVDCGPSPDRACHRRLRHGDLAESTRVRLWAHPPHRPRRPSNTRRGRSDSGSAPPACWDRWELSATPSTTK